MSYVDFIYPRWNENLSVGMFHMNRAAIANRWDIFNQILDFYVQHEETSEIARTYGLLVAHVFQRKDIAKGIDTIYGIDDLTNIIPAYYQYLFNRPPPMFILWDIISNTPAESLVGFIHPRMKIAIQSDPRWYRLQLNKPRVGDVISGNVSSLPYVGDLHSVPSSIGELTYAQLVSHTLPVQRIDASQSFDIITRARVVTPSMIYAATSFASKFNLLLPMDANPVMVEFLSGYINVIDNDPARQLAVELSKAVINVEENGSEFILV